MLSDYDVLTTSAPSPAKKQRIIASVSPITSTQSTTPKNREGTTNAKVAAPLTSFIEGTTTARTSVASNGEGISVANPTISDFEWTTADGKELPLLTDDETGDNSNTQKTHSDVTVDVAGGDQAELSPESTSDVLQERLTEDDEAVEMRSTARVETPPPPPPGEEQPLLSLTGGASTGKYVQRISEELYALLL